MFKDHPRLRIASVIAGLVVTVYAAHVALHSVGGFIEVVAAVFVVSLVTRWVRDWHAGDLHFGDAHLSDRPLGARRAGDSHPAGR